MKHTPESRKQILIRRWFWTPVTLGAFIWVGYLYAQILAS